MFNRLVRLFSSRQGIAFCAFAYVILIMILYKDVAFLFSSEEGFGYRTSPLSMILFAAAIAVAPVLYLPLGDARVSATILWLLYYTFYVPSIVLPQYLLNMDGSRIAGWMLMIFAGFSITRAGNLLPLFNVRRPRMNLLGYFAMLMVFWLIFVIVIYWNFGLTMDFSSLGDVYGQRSDFKDELADSGSLVAGYVVILSGYWLAPAMLLGGIYFVKLRSLLGWVLIGLGLCLAAYVYSVAAYKSIALSFLLVLAFSNLMGRKGTSASKITVAVLGFVSVAWVFSALPGVDFVADHLVRRAFLVPGMNASYFYDYYSHWGIKEPASFAPQVISSFYYGTNGSANAGYLAAGYSSLGPMGVLITGIGAAVAIWSADLVSRQLPFVFVSSSFLLQAYALSNSALGTALGTYGFLLTVLTLYCSPFRDEQFVLKKKRK